MKLVAFFFVIISFASLPFAVYAEEKVVTAEEKEKFIGEMMNAYATIAGGWYLEKKCHFLSNELLKEFEDNIAASTVGMHTMLSLAQPLIYKLQEAGQRAANSDNWPCDDNSRDIVTATVIKAKNMNDVFVDMAKNYQGKIQ